MGFFESFAAAFLLGWAAGGRQRSRVHARIKRLPNGMLDVRFDQPRSQAEYERLVALLGEAIRRSNADSEGA